MHRQWLNFNATGLRFQQHHRIISWVVLHATHSNRLHVSHTFCESDLKVYRETNCFANYLRRGLQVITPLGHLSRQHTNALERNVS